MVGSALAGLADSKRPLPVLTSWKLRSGGEGLLFRPPCSKCGGSRNRAPTFMRQHTLRRHLALGTWQLALGAWRLRSPALASLELDLVSGNAAYVRLTKR